MFSLIFDRFRFDGGSGIRLHFDDGSGNATLIELQRRQLILDADRTRLILENIAETRISVSVRISRRLPLVVVSKSRGKSQLPPELKKANRKLIKRLNGQSFFSPLHRRCWRCKVKDSKARSF